MKTHEIDAPWAMEHKEICEALAVDPKRGLSDAEVPRRREKYGPNRLKVAKRRPVWDILKDQVENLIVLLLAAAAILSFIFGQTLEGVSVVVVIVINTGIGFFTEYRATRSMESLREMRRLTCKVKRNGRVTSVPMDHLTPGDVVLVAGGDVAAADIRLTEAARLQADESTLTGESVPVGKTIEPLPADTPLADRTNMLFKGTAVTDGSGEGIVVTVGMDTELGKISAMTQAAQGEESPLEKRLDRLGNRLIWVTLAITFFVAVAGFLAGKDILLIVETAIALAVAAIPEGLPIVATIALARGMWRMAENEALINRLSAVETLGATSVICTDKTGTLTENRMVVDQIEPIGAHVSETELLRIGILCGNAQIDPQDPENDSEAVGDPMEIALLRAGHAKGLHHSELLEKYPEVREEAFDPKRKMMATIHQTGDGFLTAVKGAPEAVIQSAEYLREKDGDKRMESGDRTRWREKNQEMAEGGVRVLAFAAKTPESLESDPYRGLTFLGLIGFRDPPRAGIRETVEACRKAGIRVVMVTGDQIETAVAVGKKIALTETGEITAVNGTELNSAESMSDQEKQKRKETGIFARVSPEQKLNIISIFQEAGEVVAMTGDGVNDAPALKSADIGVAMGRRGAQTARETADMILKDDNFNTLVTAVQQGRTIFDNIRKFIIFLLSGNISEIMVVTAAILAGMPLPLLPLQILYLNVIGDVFPALAIGVGKGDESKMDQRPRKANEPILNTAHWTAIVAYGALIAAVVMAIFIYSLNVLKVDPQTASTIAFLSLSFSRLWHVFNMRDRTAGVFVNDITKNPFIWAALALCISLLLIAPYTPVLSGALSLAAPTYREWLLIAGGSLVPLIVGQGVMRFR